MRDIVLRDVSKSFDGQAVLRGVSASFPAGKTSAVMAPSGAGKTTLLRVLLGLERADSGEVTGLEGQRLAAVFQEDRLLDHLDAVSNVLLVNRSLDRAVIESRLRLMGIDEPGGKPVRDFSGGMRRRVALLRALLSGADVLLMDEPFKGLDAETKGHVIRQTAELLAGRTCILVTHDEEEARQMGAALYTLQGISAG